MVSPPNSGSLVPPGCFNVPPRKPQNHPPTPFYKLSGEIILIIGDFLEPKDLSYFMQTARRFTQLLASRLYRLALTYKVKNYPDSTVLEWAAHNRQVSLVEKLLEMGADVSSDHRYTALHRAADMGSETITRLLINAGAPVSALKEQHLYGTLPNQDTMQLLAYFFRQKMTSLQCLMMEQRCMRQLPAVIIESSSGFSTMEHALIYPATGKEGPLYMLHPLKDS